MFSKLLKYEWKQCGLLGVLSLCALGAGLLGGFVLRGIFYLQERLQEQEVLALGITGLSGAMVFIVLALVAYGFAVEFFTLYRFYKNKFTDEGYLTFTLPVSVHQIFLSSFLNILIWTIISVLVLLAAVCMILFIGCYGVMWENGINWSEILQYWNLMEGELKSVPGYGAYCVLTVISACIAPLYSLVLLMTSITVGSVVAKKHKVLAAVGMFYCINFAVNIVESILTAIPTITSALSGTEDYYAYANTALVVSLLLQIGLSVGGYFLCTYLMKRKLNLP